MGFVFNKNKVNQIFNSVFHCSALSQAGYVLLIEQQYQQQLQLIAN